MLNRDLTGQAYRNAGVETHTERKRSDRLFYRR